MTEQVPREARFISMLMANCSISECEPKVIALITEFMQKYCTNILQDAQVYSEHAGRGNITLSDVRLAINTNSKKVQSKTPSRTVRDYTLVYARVSHT